MLFLRRQTCICSKQKAAHSTLSVMMERWHGSFPIVLMVDAILVFIITGNLQLPRNVLVQRE